MISLDATDPFYYHILTSESEFSENVTHFKEAVGFLLSKFAFSYGYPYVHSEQKENKHEPYTLEDLMVKQVCYWVRVARVRVPLSDAFKLAAKPHAEYYRS